MKHLMASFFILTGCLGIFVTDASAIFRCGSKIVDLQTSKADILQFCGEPTRKTTRTQEVHIKNCASETVSNPKATDAEKRSDPCIRMIPVEEWFYNFGSTEYTYTLIFENGKLVRIVQGPHGY